MSNSTNKELKLAVLIDADNVPYSNVKGMMEEIAKFGTPTTKRIYADWCLILLYVDLFFVKNKAKNIKIS